MVFSSKRLRARLAEREELARADVLDLFTEGLACPDVETLVTLLETEVGIPIGLLRPEDRIDDVFAPFTLGNPLTWMTAEMRLEDGLTEIGHELRKRLKARGQSVPQCDTVRELFVAWCGTGK